MATERLSMRKTREVLRLKWVLGRSHREIRSATGVGLATVSETASRAQVAGLDWTQVCALSDDELEARLYPRPEPGTRRALPDPAHIHLELRRTGVTLQLLHVEYLEAHPDGYGYTQFCRHYQEWLGRRWLPMRQVHKAGDKLFVDYSGKKPQIVDPKTGEVVEVELFVAVLGASNFTFAEATATQRSQDFIASHSRAVEFLGGVPGAVVPDQLKSAVTVPSRYEPGVQRTYAEWAAHYGTVILPARPAHPRDKAKVEAGVLVAQRWILARLRHQTFFSLEALNARIAELCDELNCTSRRSPIRESSGRGCTLVAPAVQHPAGYTVRDCLRRGVVRRRRGVGQGQAGLAGILSRSAQRDSVARHHWTRARSARSEGAFEGIS